MPEKRKWQTKSNQQSFDNPEKEKDANENTRSTSPNRILSILGKNIGLLSRKHSRERQKKKYEEETQRKNSGATNNRKSLENKNFGNILNFSRAKTSVTKPRDQQKIREKTPVKQSRPSDVLFSPKKLLSSSKNNVTTSTAKQQKIPHGVTNVTIIKSNTLVTSTEGKPNLKPSTYKQNMKPKSNSAKPLIAQKINTAKMKKSKSDSALNERQGKTVRAASAQSNTSRASSTATSRSSSLKSSSKSSSKSSTPALKKKKTKPVSKKSKRVSETTDTSETQQPVVYVNYRHQNRRLVTTRQRQELYSLNLMMTELERENFIRVCKEKGYSVEN